MANPAIVVILVATADVQDPTTIALTRVVREALGPDATVVVQEVGSIPKPDDATALGKKLHADAVASVTWTSDDRRRAHVRVVIVADGNALDRDLDFAIGDVDVERGRTIGLTIVAMVPEKKPEPEPAVAPPPLLPPPAPVTPTPIVEQPLPPRAEAPRFGLDAFGLGASGPLSAGGGLGGRFLVVRVAAALRSGRIGDATLRAIDLTAGIAPQLVDGRISLGARVELGATQQSVTMRGEEKSRFVSFGRVLGETAWWPSPGVGFGLAAGVEIAFGETRVLVEDTAVGSIPRARFLLELSVRARR
jgi:hypothetical protein